MENKTFWLGVFASVVGGIAVLWIGARYFGVGQFTGFGGGGPQNAGADPVTPSRPTLSPVVYYENARPSPTWSYDDPTLDLYNAGKITPDQAGIPVNYFGTPMGRRTDSATRVGSNLVN